MPLPQKCFKKKDIYLEPEFLILHFQVISVKILHKYLLLCPQRLRSGKGKELIKFLTKKLQRAGQPSWDDVPNNESGEGNFPGAHQTAQI